MNRSCNSILCRFGIHTADPYVHIQVKSKKCVCGNEMTREDWKHEWVCHRCGRKRPIPLPPMFTVFMCRKCEHLLYVEEDEDFPQKLGKIAAKSCPCCGEQEEGLWRLLGRAEGFEGTVFTEESDED